MSQELMGLEYLKKKEIKNMKCDMNKPFALLVIHMMNMTLRLL